MMITIFLSMVYRFRSNLNYLVRDRGIVFTACLGGVSFRLNFLALLTRLFPDKVRPLMSR
jgi:hypothetical protein